MGTFTCIHALIEEIFKTNSIHKDSTSIHFEEKVSWKNDDLNVKTKLEVGKIYFVFLYTPSGGEYLTENNKHAKYYLLIDNILGIQERNEKMLGYLEGRRYTEIKK